MNPRARKRRRAHGSIALVTLVLVAGRADAQPSPPRIPGRPPPPVTLRLGELVGGPIPPTPEAEGTSLRKRVGIHRGSELLKDDDWRERVRGIDRLASDGSDEAIDALVEAMADGTPVFNDVRTRLTAVRAVAPLARRKEVREALSRIVLVMPSSGEVSDEGSDDPLDELTRITAAMALARAGTRESIDVLVAKALDRRTGELARRALFAHRPASLAPLVKMFERRTSAAIAIEHRALMIELLGDLGDPRAIVVLRNVLRTSQNALAEASMVALAKLGDSSAAVRARALLAGKKPPRSARLAAAETLLSLDAPDAPRVIAGLLGEASTRDVGFELAERSLSPALVSTLEAVARAPVPQSERLRATALLGRIGGSQASRTLIALLAVSELATTAAFGLAQSSGDTAGEGLARALSAATPGAAKRLVMRAAVARYLMRGERVRGLGAALEAALAGDEADRAVAAFGLAVLGERSIESLLDGGRPEVRHAAARAALALGPDALLAVRRAPPKNEDAEPDADTVAAGAAMLADADHVSTRQLARWAEGGGPLAPLAAMRLAMRDSLEYRSRLTQLLDGTDPVVRAHVALGLGSSPEKDAVSLLVDAYRIEPDAGVRRALVRGLSQRNEQRRRVTLERARDYDPDPAVRALARSALAGRRLGTPAVPAGRQVAWVLMRANSEAQKASVASRPAALVRADGLALPVVSDPDGGLLVPGLEDAGKLSLRLAPLATKGASGQGRDNGAAKPRSKR